MSVQNIDVAFQNPESATHYKDYSIVD